MPNSALAGRIRILHTLHKIITNIGDEECYNLWVTYGVPDEPSDDDYNFIASSEQCYTDTLKLFASLIDQYYN